MAIWQLSWNAPTTRTDGTELPSNQISGYVVRRVFNGVTTEFPTTTNSYLLDIGPDSGVGTLTVAAVDLVGTMSDFVTVPNVAPYNNAPTINSTALASISIKINANDSDSDPLTFSVQTAPTKGSASVVNGVIRYTPTAGQSGSDSFVVSTSDGRTGGTVDSTVSVNLTSWQITSDNLDVRVSRA